MQNRKIGAPVTGMTQTSLDKIFFFPFRRIIMALPASKILGDYGLVQFDRPYFVMLTYMLREM
jgi:hypothetical protein